MDEWVVFCVQVVSLPLSITNPCNGPVEYTWAAHGSTCAQVAISPPQGTVLPGQTLLATVTVEGKAAGEIMEWITCQVKHGDEMKIPLAGSITGATVVLLVCGRHSVFITELILLNMCWLWEPFPQDMHQDNVRYQNFPED